MMQLFSNLALTAVELIFCQDADKVIFQPPFFKLTELQLKVLNFFNPEFIAETTQLHLAPLLPMGSHQLLKVFLNYLVVLNIQEKTFL